MLKRQERVIEDLIWKENTKKWKSRKKEKIKGMNGKYIRRKW